MRRGFTAFGKDRFWNEIGGTPSKMTIHGVAGTGHRRLDNREFDAQEIEKS